MTKGKFTKTTTSVVGFILQIFAPIGVPDIGGREIIKFVKFRQLGWEIWEDGLVNSGI